METNKCHVCGKEAPFRCPCRTIHYCGVECQAKDRPRHQSSCKIPSIGRHPQVEALSRHHQNFVASRKASTKCAICLETFGSKHEGLRTLPCGHKFHDECFTEGIYRCPLCRAFCIPTEAESADLFETSPNNMIRAMLGFVFLSRATETNGDTSKETGEAWIEHKLREAAPVMSGVEHILGQAVHVLRQSGQEGRKPDAEDISAFIGQAINGTGLVLGTDLAEYSPHLSKWFHEVFQG